MASPSDRLYTQAEAQKPSELENKGLTDLELQSVIREHLVGAINYRDETLAPDRRRTQSYFEGEETLDGDLVPRKGRSKYVSRDVSETINQIMPDLVDIFLGDDEAVVEFVPHGPEDAMQARAATLYVNYLVRKHGGLQLFWPVFMDALKNKVGIVRYWWDESKCITEKEYEGLTPEQFAALTVPEDDDTEIEVVEEEREAVMVEAMDPMTGQPTRVQSETIDCTLKITKKERGCIRLAAVPPEERLVDENARSLAIGEFSFWGHARNVKAGELIALGFDEDDVYDLWEGDAFLTDEEAERREQAGDRTADDGEGDPSMRTVPYAEVFLYGDIKQEGAMSLWRICVGGVQATILREPERVEHLDVAEFLSQPIEHVATGKAYAENVVPLAGLRTSLWRGMLDSLAQSIFPQRGFHEGMVNVNDLMNDEPGALVRCRTAPSQVVQEFVHPFTGADVLGVLQYTDQVKENRTGVSRTSAGLDPNVLQSTAKEAASHTVSASQKQIKMLARIIAEWGMKPLMKGILRLVVKHQKYADTVRLLNGEWAQFDPRGWNPDMDCIVRVGKGTGSTQDQIEILQGFLAVQEKLFGAQSPLVDESKVYNTLEAMVRLTQFRDASRFFNPPQAQQPGAPQPGKQEGPTPEMALAEAEKIKAMAERESAKEKNINDRVKLLLEDDRERDRIRADFSKAVIVELLKQGNMAAIEQERMRMEQEINRERNYSELAARAQAFQSPPGGAQPQQGAPQQ